MEQEKEDLTRLHVELRSHSQRQTISFPIQVQSTSSMELEIIGANEAREDSFFADLESAISIV